MALKWYVVNTYSGHEKKAQAALLERIKQSGLDEQFGQVLVPTEQDEKDPSTKRVKKGKKFFPGYMLVEMEMTEEAWLLVKNTPRVTSFVGRANKPRPIPTEEVERITKQMEEGSVRVTPEKLLEEGSNVKVIDGPFLNFTGVVENVNPDKQKVRVLVSIFGRATPVELNFSQVERT